MLKQLWTKIKDFWFSFGELREPDDYFYLKDGVFIPYSKVKLDAELTHREVQQLRSLLKQQIMYLEDEVSFVKTTRDYYWQHSSKGDANTSVAFYNLNCYKDRLVTSKANLKKLVNLQTKLKRLKGM
jgi:hypothetical protein